MKEYPKTFGFNEKYLGEYCWSFDKKDGSNLRFEYSLKSKKWYKFGTRRRLFDKSDSEYGLAIDIFMNKYSEGIEKILQDKYKKCESAIAFAEFFGANSFAGQHKEEEKDLILFDVNIHKKGFISPKDFIEQFKHLHIPDIIYEGEVTQEFFQEIREGNKYNLNEGVMCKGGSGHDFWMFKIKTLKYLEKLKALYGEGWKEFWE